MPVKLGAAGARAVLYQSVFESIWAAPKSIYLADLRYSSLPADWNAVAGQRDALQVILNACTELELERGEAPWATWPDKRVLVLGDFSEEHRPRLDRIAVLLRDLGYIPVFVDKVPDIRDQQLLQKVSLLIAICRFTIMDDSSRGGHLAEIPLLIGSGRSAAILRLDGTHSSFMAAGLAGPGSHIHELDYVADTLQAVVGQAVAKLERDIEFTGVYLDQQYPWRNGDGATATFDLGVAPTVRRLRSGQASG